MKRVVPIVGLGLAALLIAVPGVIAQSSNTNVNQNTNVNTGRGAQGESSSSTSTESRSGSGGSTNRNTNTNVNTNTGGQASPMTPGGQDDCKDNRWQRYGFADEAACVTAATSEKKSR